MEEETPGNGKMPGEGRPSGDEAIQLLWEQVEKLTKELDQLRRDMENRWAETMNTLNRILLQQATTTLTSTVTILLTYPTLTIHSQLSNKPAKEKGTLVPPPKEMSLLIEHPQTINLF